MTTNLTEEPRAPVPFQERVRLWVTEAFGIKLANDTDQRTQRFLEEALELAQSAGLSEYNARQLVRYVYSRPVGELTQEVGGTMVTLAAFCSAHSVNMDDCADTELSRCWDKIPIIRAKQVTKPKLSHTVEEADKAPVSVGASEPVAHCKTEPLRGDESLRRHSLVWVNNRPLEGPLYTKGVGTEELAADLRAAEREIQILTSQLELAVKQAETLVAQRDSLLQELRDEKAYAAQLASSSIAE